MICGCIIFFLAMLFIIVMIAAGFKIAADAKIEEAEKSVQRKAERLAREIVKERLNGVRLQVTQRISVIEDDLTGGGKE
jgi:uncharacterized membrane protein